MGSHKYVGYVGGVAVAVGVGAAIAAASQGVASADTGKSESSSSSASKPDAGPKKSTTGTSKRVKPVSKPAEKAPSAAASETKAPSSTLTSAKTTAAAFEAAQVERLEGLFKGTGHAAPKTAAVDLTDTSSAATTPAAGAIANATVPWSPNPFRPLPPEPRPQDMPGPIWTLEESFIAIFPDLVKPVAREGFELGYRLTQMIPWVNVVVPLTNIVTDLPLAFQGDKAASQRVINNLIVTIHPVAVLYYGYNEIADVLNLEEPALRLQTWAIATAWNVIDLFALFHNRGEAGLPLSTTTPPPYGPEEEVEPAAAVKLTAAATPTANDDVESPDPASDPFRADDPRPIGMPNAVYASQQALLGLFPADISPIVRELYEASWRISQMVPGLNTAVSIANLLPAFVQAATGNRTAAQIAINNLVLATTPLSILYYGYDQIADLLNREAEAQARKEEIFAAAWDELDPRGLLHVPGRSGLATA